MTNKHTANDLSFGTAFDSSSGGVAYVAPSVTEAYDTVQGALDDGYIHVKIAEDITEDNIIIDTDGTRIEGCGDTGINITHNPNNNPLFTTDGADISDVLITNIGTNTDGAVIEDTYGPVIDAWPANNNGARGWRVYDCDFRSGPIVMKGPRNYLTNVVCNNESTNKYPEVGKPTDANYETGAALIVNGLTFNIWGGTYSNKANAREAIYWSGGGGNIGGGVTVTNAGDVLGGETQGSAGYRDILFVGSNTMWVGGMSFESSKEYTMQFGNDYDDGTGVTGMAGASNMTFMSVPCRLRVEGNNSGDLTFFDPQDNVTIDLDARADMVFYLGSSQDLTATRVSGGASVNNDVTVVTSVGGSDAQKQILGGPAGAPTTQTAFQPRDTDPNRPETGAQVNQDGTNWDPVGSGIEQPVRYDGSNWLPGNPTFVQVALGGGTPTASNYAAGTWIEDSDNPGTVYLITPSGNATQIGT